MQSDAYAVLGMAAFKAKIGRKRRRICASRLTCFRSSRCVAVWSLAVALDMQSKIRMR